MLQTLLKDFSDLFYPSSCLGCKQPLVEHENTLCLFCINELPKTNYHHYAENNPVHSLFTGRCQIKKATAFIYFNKGGIVQSMMHALKYKGHKELAAKLGIMATQELKESNFFSNIDLIVPIPLHPKKRKLRGFNQSEIIAEAISKESQVPISFNNLIRRYHNPTQTRKSRFARWLNVKSIFELKNALEFENKHILIIDDILTTGATIESCVDKLTSIKNVKCSVFTLGIAQ